MQTCLSDAEHHVDDSNCYGTMRRCCRSSLQKFSAAIAPGPYPLWREKGACGKEICRMAAGSCLWGILSLSGAYLPPKNLRDLSLRDAPRNEHRRNAPSNSRSSHCARDFARSPAFLTSFQTPWREISSLSRFRNSRLLRERKMSRPSPM